MKKQYLTQLLKEKIRFSFSRSGGPGGQNVNKVNTKVTAQLDIRELKFLSNTELSCIKTKLKNKINNQNEITIQVQEKRTQAKNREIAVHRIAALIIQALAKKKKRIHTKPSRKSIENRLKAKKRRSELKWSRKKVDY